MEKKKVTVLDHLRIKRIIERFTHQIIEDFYHEKSIVLIGISGRGVVLAKRIFTLLSEHSKMKVSLATLSLDKDNPYNRIPELSISESLLNNQVVLLIDDVLNSGQTLMHSICHVIKSKVKQVSTVVLVDRIHRKFPVRADYVGLTLSTNLQEHVSVEFNSRNDWAYLS